VDPELIASSDHEFEVKQLVAHHELLCQLARDLMVKKNADYTNDGGGDGGVFSNFTKAEAFGICTTEQGILVRLTDKVARLATLIRRSPEVRDERFRDTIIDLINYATILDAWMDQDPETHGSDTPYGNN